MKHYSIIRYGSQEEVRLDCTFLAGAEVEVKLSNFQHTHSFSATVQKGYYLEIPKVKQFIKGEAVSVRVSIPVEEEIQEIATT